MTATQAPPAPSRRPPLPPAPEPHNRAETPRRRRRRWRALLAVLAVAMLGAGSWAAVVANRPGNERFTAKAADWFRDHHLQTVANWVERVYFEQQAPPTGGTPKRAIPSGSAVAPPVARPSGHQVPAPIIPAAQPSLPNEGTWTAVGPLVNGAPGMATAQLRPDASHTSVLAGVVWMDPQRVRFQYVPGTQEPGGSFAVRGSVPTDQRGALLAAFNGGFRFKDSRGGVYTEGRVVKPLVAGAASFVVRADGSADVVQWGRDMALGPNVASVRQNLALLVDGGQPVAGIDNNSGTRWGLTLGNKTLVWRSGVGVRADGTIVYVASDGLSVSTLADLLVRAGAVRAMELDINPEWVTFNLYSNTGPAGVTGTKLLPDMTRPGSRYLGADSRDFFAVYTR